MSEQTIYNWRKHFGGLESADVKRLRQLEQENARLTKLVAMPETTDLALASLGLRFRI